MKDDIGGGFQEGAVFQEGEGFKCKGGVGREAAQNTDEEKDANVGSQKGSCFCQSMQQANQETAQDIHGERSNGKPESRTEPVEYSRHNETADGTQKSA